LRRVRADAGRRVAGAHVVALIRRGAGHRVGADADTGLAAVALGAGGAVVAAGAVGLRRGRAAAGRRVARPRVVATIRRGAAPRVGAVAGTGVAAVGVGARVSLLAALAICLRRVRADAGRRVAGAQVVALIRRGAAHRVGADAGAGMAAVALGAGVAVVAARAVGLRRVRADTRLRVAGAGRVALVGGRARDRGA